MYFVDRSKITATLAYMDRLLTTFEQKTEWRGLLDELALERLTLNVIESIIDVGNSMIDGFIMRDPGSYEDILDILLDEKVISDPMHQPLLQVISLRKMLVREFAAANHAELIEVLVGSMNSLKEFRPRVQAYLTDELGPVSAFSPEEAE
ncbi:DUF86 domain-containing protein [Planococcus lenghuensis]|uniref:DUF86 domain-containing protein n=1 Tax=Planococcus lenghuensis TaxID=2213202 RepID=A0A1Q2KWW4_9BACL|nr:DUF86 domain-containing protein [Planococcus lenghuensis]AQQ52698.1 hypothetical protein B0X71_06020 [Planococcus lenghuensis]